MQIALPSDAAKQPLGIGLPLLPSQQPQAGLHDLTLGPEASCRHRLGQQRVVALDVVRKATVLSI
jgi:hypothetical protein